MEILIQQQSCLCAYRDRRAPHILVIPRSLLEATCCQHQYIAASFKLSSLSRTKIACLWGITEHWHCMLMYQLLLFMFRDSGCHLLHASLLAVDIEGLVPCVASGWIGGLSARIWFETRLDARHLTTAVASLRIHWYHYQTKLARMHWFWEKSCQSNNDFFLNGQMVGIHTIYQHTSIGAQITHTTLFASPANITRAEKLQCLLTQCTHWYKGQH